MDFAARKNLAPFELAVDPHGSAPQLSWIRDVTAVEGNSAKVKQKAAVGSDHTTTSEVLTFNPGEINKVITVSVIGR
jgi:hypothetical protein